MGAEEHTKAPTVTIETVLVVRPIKVIAVMCAVFAILLLMLSIAATTWLQAGRTREGLFEICTFNGTQHIDCEWNHNEGHEWITICQVLCFSSLVTDVIAIVITTIGLRTDNFKIKYKLYFAGLCTFFIAVGVQLVSLVVFPIKFLDEVSMRDKDDWKFGWAYVIGWAGGLCEFAAGMFLLVDRGAEEIVYRERVLQEETRNGIEATEDV